MTAGAYYNEHDEYAAEWLRNLIMIGAIAPGDVDSRSIEDVTPDDLRPYTQCHFFAGIGVWSLALRRAGWPDDRPVWTGSCPCQPFSAAGQGVGFADERHLWPAWDWLIAQCHPPAILGEQVASKDADAWIDLVQTDLEGMGYAVGAVAFPSAGIGAPHIRDRTYWMADAASARSQRRQPGRQRLDAQRAAVERGGAAGGLVNADHVRRGARLGNDSPAGHGATAEPTRGIGGVGDSNSERAGRVAGGVHSAEAGEGRRGRGNDADASSAGVPSGTGPTNGLWRDADWLLCRDGKWRPVEPGTFPLAHGATSRVGRLRAYGNAINVEAARQFILATDLI